MTAVGRVTVIGLGPAGADLLPLAAAAAIERLDVRHLRTARHPAADAVGRAVAFDDLYDAATAIEDVYPAMVEALVASAAEHGEVLYAVPGSPVVAETSVELLVADPRVEVELVPAMSFLDLAWVRLGIDPVALGVRVVDGHRFAVEAAGARGPLLVAQVDSRLVAGDVKLAVGEVVDGLPATVGGDLEVVVLERLGLPDESIRTLPWYELDRFEPDHLTTVWIPELAAPVAGAVARFAELVATLRAECPWDRDQTHASLRRHLIEEAYEVLDAIDGVDPDTGVGYEHLEEELGDLLFQVLFHTTLATEAGQFTLADVATTVHDKLRDRHPHVFGDVAAGTPEQVAADWEQAKKAEKARDSVFDGIPPALPALLLATKVAKKAATLDVDGAPSAPDLDGALDRWRADPDGEALGSVLLAVVDRARRAGVDPETELRAAAEAWRVESRRAELGG